MKKNKIIFIVIISLINILAIYILTNNYDLLSRYPYQNEAARTIIRENLNEEEIEYLIEYSIAPEVFIEYATYENFSVYRSDAYNYLKQYAWYLTAEQIVEIDFVLNHQYDADQVINYLNVYGYDTYMNYLINIKPKNADLVLVENPAQLDTYLDENNTILNKQPDNLVPIDSVHGNDIYLDQRLVLGLKDMCAAIENDLELDECANLEVFRGYISYDEQKELYENNESSIMPGHSNYQLGLIVDFKVSDYLYDYFAVTKQNDWLVNNAYKYGFVNDETVNSYRYVGIENAIVNKMENQDIVEENNQ